MHKKSPKRTESLIAKGFATYNTSCTPSNRRFSSIFFILKPNPKSRKHMLLSRLQYGAKESMYNFPLTPHFVD